MKRIRTISLLVVLFIATVLMLPMAAGAATSDRTLPASVDPSAQFTVSMTVVEYGSAGKVVETLPAGFTYVDSTMDAAQVIVDGDTVTFVLLGETSFSYDVDASSTGGTYAFSGLLTDIDKTTSAVGGDTSIDVGAESVDPVDASAVRTSPASVEPDAQFTVSMTVVEYGSAGKVVETLPAEFTYVDSTMDAAQVMVDGDTVTFVLLGETSFSYDVDASSTDGTYAFSGLLTDIDKATSAVGGDTSIAVETVPVDAGPDASAVRTLSATSVEPGVQFTVSITATEYGSAGQVVETLPDGFTYVDSTLDASQVAEAGNTVTFTLVDESSFDYTVEASGTDGTYAFSGIIKDFDAVEFAVTGDTSIDVVTPPEDIPLDAGWNFISIPHELADPSVDGVLEGVAYDALAYYDAQTRQWDDVSTFEPLKGYWINVSATDQVILEGSLAPATTGGTELPALQLYEGWNAIGSMYSVAHNAEFVLQSIDDHLTKIVGPWNDGEYELIGHNGQSGVREDGDVGTDIFEMSPYSGYWVFVTEDDLMG